MSNYYLGLDVSKGYSDFIMLNQNKHAVDRNLQFDDTAAGHHHLEMYLSAFFDQNEDAEVFAAVESTGGYENNWYNRLIELGNRFPIHVTRLNPARVKASSEASAKHNKTDAISAKDVAEYLISHPEKVTYQKTEDQFPLLRRQWNFIQLNIKMKTQLLNHLESVLYTSMPEILRFCRPGVPNWLLRLLKHYPTYEALLKAGVDQLASQPYVSVAKIKRLLKLVEQGIGESNETSGQIIATIAKQILELETQINFHKKLLEKNYLEAQTQVDLLRTFKGIGVYSAVGLLLNIPGGIQSFSKAKKLASFWGMHPVYKKSGDGKWGYHISKKGRTQPRAILYMVTWSALQYNPLIKELYASSRAKGMQPKAAMGVCMHKILRIVYGMLKTNTSFDPEIDRKNQQTYQNLVSKRKTNKKRSLQPFDENAPISRTQHKKRKKQTQSQDENIVQCGIGEPALPS